MAAEAGAGQADGKPEVKHENDEHLRTKDSSCGQGGETDWLRLRPPADLSIHPGGLLSVTAQEQKEN